MFGKIVRISKGYTYNKARQPWGHIVCYEVDFYKAGEKVLAYHGDDPITFWKTFHTKSEMKRYLLENGYTKQDMEVFQC